MHVQDLSDSIRTRVLTAGLPRDLRTPVISGPSDGLGVCGCCAHPIGPPETQHEVGSVLMHTDCFRLWRNVVETLYLLDGAAGVRRVLKQTSQRHIESSCL